MQARVVLASGRQASKLRHIYDRQEKFRPMGQVFVIRNQDGLYLTKQQQWHNGEEANLLFKSTHHDVALNTLIEANAKDFTLRLEIIQIETNEKGLPLVEVTAANPESATADNVESTGELQQDADTARESGDGQSGNLAGGAADNGESPDENRQGSSDSTEPVSA